MSNRIQMTFEKLQGKGEKALIPYIMAGDPSLSETESLVLALEQAGADLIELGVPFSDPIADGPVIQKAAERSLRAGTTLTSILVTVKALRTKTQIPLILMTYYNTILAMGEQEFCQQAVEAGIDGVIVPDMPSEEADSFYDASVATNGPVIIFLLAPTSTRTRQNEVTKRTRGFIYYVSITGITGAKINDIGKIRKDVEKIRKTTRKPIAVGFGISTPEDAKQISEFADGVIVGSAIVRQIGEYQNDPFLVAHIEKFTKSLKASLK